MFDELYDHDDYYQIDQPDFMNCFYEEMYADNRETDETSSEEEDYTSVYLEDPLTNSLSTSAETLENNVEIPMDLDPLEGRNQRILEIYLACTSQRKIHFG
jgi:hypothetical protein